MLRGLLYANKSTGRWLSSFRMEASLQEYQAMFRRSALSAQCLRRGEGLEIESVTKGQ